MPSINQFVAPKSPLQGLAELGNVIGQVRDWSNKSKQSDLLDQDVKAKTLANQQAGIVDDQSQALLKANADPHSPQSQDSRNIAKATLAGIRSSGLDKSNPQAFDDMEKNLNDPEFSGVRANAIDTGLKNLVTLGGAQIKGNSMMPLAQARMAGVDNQKDKIAADAANHFDNDSLLKKITAQRQQVALDKHTLDTAPVMTPQIWNEVNMGLANAIAGGKSAAVSSQQKTEMNSAEIDYKALVQRVTNNPQDIASPEFKKAVSDTLTRIDAAYANNSAARAQQIFKGRSQGYAHNPNAIAVMKDKVADYQPAAQSAEKAPPNGHQSVQQNGHTYNWNSQTGQYE